MSHCTLVYTSLSYCTLHITIPLHFTHHRPNSLHLLCCPTTLYIVPLSLPHYIFYSLVPVGIVAMENLRWLPPYRKSQLWQTATTQPKTSYFFSTLNKCLPKSFPQQIKSPNCCPKKEGVHSWAWNAHRDWVSTQNHRDMLPTDISSVLVTYLT